MLLSRARAIAARATASRPSAKLCVARATTRSLSSEPKRPKAIKVKKSEARRRMEPKPEPNALAEVPQAQPPSPFVHSQQEPPQTFGQVMKMNFFWGIGMALAFSFIGVIFSRMKEVQSFDIPIRPCAAYASLSAIRRTAEPGEFDGSSVLAAGTTDDE